MEMEIKSAKDENLHNSVPFVKQLSMDNDSKKNIAINDDSRPYDGLTTQKKYLYTQVGITFFYCSILGSIWLSFLRPRFYRSASTQTYRSK